MALVHDTSSRRGLQVYQVSLKNLKQFLSYRADTICDGQTDGRTDRRMGKNNMSPDPVGGRHNYSYMEYVTIQNLNACLTKSNKRLQSYQMKCLIKLHFQ